MTIAACPCARLAWSRGASGAEGRAEINLSDIELKRTGRESIRRVMRLSDYEFEIRKGEEFALCDREITRQMIGGLFLPLCVESVRTYEVTETNIQRDIAEAKALTGENARQNAVKKCPDNAFVIDKWTEYSIIEGDTIEARYVIEAEETIQCGRDSAQGFFRARRAESAVCF